VPVRDWERGEEDTCEGEWQRGLSDWPWPGLPILEKQAGDEANANGGITRFLGRVSSAAQAQLLHTAEAVTSGAGIQSRSSIRAHDERRKTRGKKITSLLAEEHSLPFG